MSSDKSRVLVVMGSDSDFPVMKECFLILKEFGIGYYAEVCSAHRTPERAADMARQAYDQGYDVIIAAAGMAAHLPGVIAAYTILPVIGIPIKSDIMDGMDSLLSIVQMPPGVPVATVGINGARNAGLLAVHILSLKYTDLAEQLKAYRSSMKIIVEEKNSALQKKIKEI